MLKKLVSMLPPGGIWLLASAALFMLGSLCNSGLGDGRMSMLGLVGVLVAVLVVMAFSGRRPQHRP